MRPIPYETTNTSTETTAKIIATNSHEASAQTAGILADDAIHIPTGQTRHLHSGREGLLQIQGTALLQALRLRREIEGTRTVFRW